MNIATMTLGRKLELHASCGKTFPGYKPGPNDHSYARNDVSPVYAISWEDAVDQVENVGVAMKLRITAALAFEDHNM